jgi:predicted AlkP superfamily pyrophosphatase or phosphodiesterase
MIQLNKKFKINVISNLFSYFIPLLYFIPTLKGFPVQNKEMPKLVVIVVVDQMRYSYLDQFYPYFEAGGFKRLLKEGFNYRNTHYNYIPTRTAPGHASIVTGTTPARHGITSNNWYDRVTNKAVFSIADSTVFTINGNEKGKKTTSYSPRNLLASTIGDELKLFHYKKPKVFGFSIKERGAVLMAGHIPNAAFWLSNGKFVTSSYYCDQLPNWLKDFNKKNKGRTYLKDGWNLLHKKSLYPPSLLVNKKTPKNNVATQFSNTISSKNVNVLGSTPFGNAYLTDVVIECLEAEKLGQQEVPDLLTISYSATDYIGHQYGAGSIEIMDTYLRLDRDIKRLLNKLDEHVGKENYVFVLTADHGGMHNAFYLSNQNLMSGYTYKKRLKNDLNAYLKSKTGVDSLIIRLRDEQIYFDNEKMERLNLNKSSIFDLSTHWLLQQSGIRDAIAIPDLLLHSFRATEMRGMLKKGVYPKRFGDIVFIHEPGWQSQYLFANHGTPYTNDTHVPMVWYGKNIPKGATAKYTTTTSLAPTLSMMLRIPLPNAADGEPLLELVDK